ncbi:MAG: dihydrodipicolinate synthase family protein [Kiloniellales bacterium]|nr:dihydrodipicolinate synthase family protein [Kiloniellales bacterium]
MRFEGIYPPILTPFNDDLSIGWTAWGETIEKQIEAGIHGIVVGGTTGEFYALSAEERRAQLRRGKDIVAGRIPMIAGVNALNAAECADYALAAKEAGADAILLAAPPYSLPSEGELASHALSVEAAAKLPIMLYNYPGRVGVEMGEAFLDIVTQNPNFVAIKEASGDINRVHLIASSYPTLQLSIGAEDQALEFFAWGARSWVSPIPNFLPAPVIRLYELCALEGNYDAGRELMQALLPITSLLERSGKYMACTKFAAELFGMPGGPVRSPLKPLEEPDREEMGRALLAAKAKIDKVLAEHPKSDAA